MKHKKNKFYKDGSFHHLYVKSIEGNILFYKPEDYLFFYTLFSILVRKHGIRVESFCIMFNHFHACLSATSHDSLKAFCRDLSSAFTLGYCKEYHLGGSILMPCGYYPKTAGKLHRSCLIYISNNPSSGKLVPTAIMYKWNLLAYFQSDHPFSEKMIKRECRFAMRQALSLVDGCHKRHQYLNFTLLLRIYKGLNSVERAQMTDYIIVKYFFLDKDSFISHFGSLEKAIVAIDSSAGAENDFFEPWEDYSVYLSMLKATIKSGLDIKRFRFHEMADDDFELLRRKMAVVPGVTKKHLDRFLHTHTSGY